MGVERGVQREGVERIVHRDAGEDRRALRREIGAIAGDGALDQHPPVEHPADERPDVGEPGERRGVSEVRLPGIAQRQAAARFRVDARSHGLEYGDVGGAAVEAGFEPRRVEGERADRGRISDHEPARRHAPEIERLAQPFDRPFDVRRGAHHARQILAAGDAADVEAASGAAIGRFERAVGHTRGQVGRPEVDGERRRGLELRGGIEDESVERRSRAVHGQLSGEARRVVVAADGRDLQHAPPALDISVGDVAGEPVAQRAVEIVETSDRALAHLGTFDRRGVERGRRVEPRACARDHVVAREAALERRQAQLLRQAAHVDAVHVT